MIIAVTDIFQLAPDFENAVVNVHNTTMPIALVVCFAGLTMAAVRAQHERCLQSIWPELMRILLVSMFLVNMDQVGSWVNGLVTDIEQAANVNGNPLAAFVAAIQQKFGVDLSALASTVSPGGTLGASGSSSSGAITVSTYGAPDDPNLDSNSAQGVGIAPFNTPGRSTPCTRYCAITESHGRIDARSADKRNACQRPDHHRNVCRSDGAEL